MRIAMPILCLGVILAACGDDRPAVPTEKEAQRLLFPSTTFGASRSYTFHLIKCAYADPPKSAKTGEWMAACKYDVTLTKKISYRTFNERMRGVARLFWREHTNHSGTKAQWVVG